MDAQDFQRNFSGSWFSVPVDYILPYVAAYKPKLKDMDRVPCTRPRFTDNGRRFQLNVVLPISGETQEHALLTSDLIAWVPDLDEDPRFDTRTPIVGMVQYDTDLVYVTTTPHRGTPRGFCPEHCDISFVTSSLCAEQQTPPRGQGRFPHSSVWDVYNPRRYGLHEALDLMYKGELRGAALSRQLGVSVAENKKYPILVYKGRSCGNVRDASTIRMYEDATPQCVRYVRKHLPWADIK